MIVITFFNQITPILQNVLILAALIGAIFVFRSTKRNGIITIQNQTIEAMQQQIDALKEQNARQQVEIDHLEFEAKATREALKDEGILITVDGEKVTIKDIREPDTTRHIIKKPTKKTTTTSHVIKKEEE